MLGNMSFCREFLSLSSPNEINFMIIYLFSQKIYSFTAVTPPAASRRHRYKCGVLPYGITGCIIFMLT